MSEQTVTLIAALIAALASLLSLIINFFAQYTSEMRTTQRKYLESYIFDLSDLFHQIVASSNMLTHDTDEGHDKRYQNWRAKSTESANKLKGLRPKLRYPLWGLDEGIRVITRFPNWVDQNRDKQDVARLLKAGDLLRRGLDYSVRNCYQNGRTPSTFERIVVSLLATNLRKTYISFSQVSERQGDEIP